MPQPGLPSNLYAGGATPLNLNAFTQNYLGNLAHQRAQEDATTKYFGELGGRLTPTGMVDEDVNDLMNMKNEWQSFNMNNKRNLANTRHDNGQSYMESMQRFNQMQDLIARSKNKSAFASKYIKPIVDDPKKYALLSDESKDAIHRAGLPVSSKDYRELKPEDISFKDKPFDTNDVSKLQILLGRYKGNMVPGSPVQDKTTGMQTITSKRQFGENDLNGMYQTGAMLYDSHSGFKHQVDEEMNPLHPDFQKNNEVFQQTYGRPIQSPVDMAAAHMLNYNPNPREDTKSSRMPTTMADKKELQAAGFAQQDKHQAIQQSHTLSNILTRDELKKGEGAAEDSKARKYFDTIYSEAKKTGRVHLASEPGKQWYSMPVSGNTKEEFKQPSTNPTTGKEEQRTPGEIFVSEDGKSILPIFYRDATNKVVDKTLSKPMTPQEFEQTAGKKLFGVKEANKNESPKPKKDPLGLF